jgi:hypothetical protein
VYLALKEARCDPSGYCTPKGTCARYLVKPEQGRPVADYTLRHPVYVFTGCAGFLDAAKHRDPLPGANGPRVHEAPKGLF